MCMKHDQHHASSPHRSQRQPQITQHFMKYIWCFCMSCEPHGMSWGGPRTSPPVQLMYSWMGFLFSVSRYSIVATSWLPSSSSIALPRKMMRSRYCAAWAAWNQGVGIGLRVRD